MPPDSDIEDVLLQYRPKGPPENLRERILASAPVTTTVTGAAARRWPLYLYRTAVAASLLFSFALYHAAEKMNQATAASVGLGPIVWTRDAEETAQLIAPGPAGRQYILDRFLATGRRVTGLSQSQETRHD